MKDGPSKMRFIGGKRNLILDQSQSKMHPNQEGQSLHHVTKFYQKYKKLLKEMQGIQYAI